MKQLATTLVYLCANTPLSLALPSSAAQVPCEAHQLFASDFDDDDRFGQAVAVDGEVALIGAFKDDDQGLNSGSAYVYRFTGTGWIEEAKLLASDGQSQDRFGWAVALDGDVALIGAREAGPLGPRSGAAYVFRRTGGVWAEEDKLVPIGGNVDDEFGSSVALGDGVALVGANFFDATGPTTGAAFVFRWNGSTWPEEQRLVASDAATGDDFGVSVDLDNEIAVVGAALESQSGTASGAAYVFRHAAGAWAQEKKLAPSDLQVNDRFGFSVSADSDRILCGSFSDDDLGSTSGSAYVFRHTGTDWVEEDKLLASDGSLVDTFGWSVSLHGNAALVGAQLEDEGGTDAGAAYLFMRNGQQWDQRAKLVASDAAASDAFGFSVSLSDRSLLVGAWGHDDVEDESGTAYFYRYAEATGTSYCAAGANSVGTGARLFATGSADPANNDVELLASCCPPSVSGLFYFGPNMANAPFGEGRRCVGGSTQRLQPPLFTDPAGTAARSVDLTSSPAAGIFVPGTTTHFQFWYRDSAGGPAGFNLSDAMQVTWQ